MQIFGLQKMTLLDFPGHVACTVFLGGCDFRCPFCHNFDLVKGRNPTEITEETFFTFLERRKNLLDGVAITGGEPCLHKDLPAFIRKIREHGYLVKLDTNGYHPDMLKQILDEKLVDYVAMDIKNCPERYAETADISEVDIEKIHQSIQLLLHGSVDYEFRTTVVNEFHTLEDFLEIGPWIRGAKRYFLQCFVDRDTVPRAQLHAPSKDLLESYAEVVQPYVETVQLRGVD